MFIVKKQKWNAKSGTPILSMEGVSPTLVLFLEHRIHILLHYVLTGFLPCCIIVAPFTVLLTGLYVRRPPSYRPVCVPYDRSMFNDYHGDYGGVPYNIRWYKTSKLLSTVRPTPTPLSPRHLCVHACMRIYTFLI